MTPATDATIRTNQAVAADLPFEETGDFDLVARGFLAPLPDTTADGGPVWDSRRLDLVTGDAPDTAGPPVTPPSLR